MKRIGNISGSKSHQVESDPDKERMRLELRSSFREEKIGRKVKRRVGEITGERALSESVSELLDSAGNPPPNAPLESIIKQQRNLSAQIKWLDAWFLVFDKKLRSLNEERYWKEKVEKEVNEDNERRERREGKGLIEIGVHNGGASKLLKSLDEAIQTDYEAARLRKYVDSDDKSARVLGLRRVESGLRFVFAEYFDETHASHLTVDEQYELIREQLSWIGIMAAEVRSKLTTVIEISEAALARMGSADRRERGG